MMQLPPHWGETPRLGNIMTEVGVIRDNVSTKSGPNVCDPSTAATDAIAYVAIDQSGLS
jgi:hypothetical protein